MGEAELKQGEKELVIHSHIVCYGGAADEVLTERIRHEIDWMWNEPAAAVYLNAIWYQVVFKITAETKKELDELELIQNTDPRTNFFRVEDYSAINISFVDGLNCNSGYFLLENLYEGSTTAAHEYGHTLGLDHPPVMDIRGGGRPGIMYPRGTLVDPQFQYDPTKPAGVTGGTMHPMHRRVRAEDVAALKLHRLRFATGKAIVGDFSNVYHQAHTKDNPNV